MNRHAGPGPNFGRIFFGGLIVFVGLLFLLDNLGLVDSGSLWRFWPIVLIAFGLLKLVSPHTRGGRVFGLILVFVGLSLLFNLWNFWPLLLILIGLTVMFGALGHGNPFRGGGATPGSAGLREFIIFGGSERRVSGPDFPGGEVTAIFGSYDVDLRDTTLAPGGAVLDVTTVFGGLELRVPESCRVVQEATVLFGGVEDNTRSTGEAAPVDGRPVLTIRGLVLFGGIEVRN